jgi:hypothetical protein
VPRGAALGRAASDRNRLSARAATGRRAYLDPLALLTAPAVQEPAPPVAPGPAAPPRSAPPHPPTARPRQSPHRTSAPTAIDAATGLDAAAHTIPAVPLPVWLGIGLIAVALPAWGVGARGRRRASAVRAPAHTTSVESTI